MNDCTLTFPCKWGREGRRINEELKRNEIAQNHEIVEGLSWLTFQVPKELPVPLSFQHLDLVADLRGLIQSFTGSKFQLFFPPLFHKLKRSRPKEAQKAVAKIHIYDCDSLLSVHAGSTGHARHRLLRGKPEQGITTRRFQLVGCPTVLTRRGPGVTPDFSDVKDHFGPFYFHSVRERWRRRRASFLWGKTSWTNSPSCWTDRGGGSWPVRCPSIPNSASGETLNASRRWGTCYLCRRPRRERERICVDAVI